MAATSRITSLGGPPCKCGTKAQNVESGHFLPGGGDRCTPSKRGPSMFIYKNVYMYICIYMYNTSIAGEAGGRKFQKYKNYSSLFLSFLDSFSPSFFLSSFLSFLSFLPPFLPSICLFFISFVCLSINLSLPIHT